jgi:predicted phosphoribosyltransferase
MFEDRRDAGRQLAKALEEYRNQDVLVLAIPRGGVEVGYEVADYLDADFSLLVARKLPYPHQPEAGFGAVVEDGSRVILEEASRWVAEEMIEQIIEEQREEIERRKDVLRGGEPLPTIEDRTVILVDDGIAMGSTMRASIKLCKHYEAARIIVAVPVASERVTEAIQQLVDKVVVLEQPSLFRAVAQVYENWYDVPDEEVVSIMTRWERQHEKGESTNENESDQHTDHHHHASDHSGMHDEEGNHGHADPDARTETDSHGDGT